MDKHSNQMVCTIYSTTFILFCGSIGFMTLCLMFLCECDVNLLVASEPGQAGAMASSPRRNNSSSPSSTSLTSTSLKITFLTSISITTRSVRFVLIIRGRRGTSSTCACCLGFTKYKVFQVDIGHLHVALIGPYPVFIKKAVKSLFIDSSLRELDLGVLAVISMDYGCAANLNSK